MIPAPSLDNPPREPTSPVEAFQRLVALHIPKTAGTALRAILESIYGRGSIYWYGRGGTEVPREFAPGQVDGYSVLGGHVPLSFYPKSENTLFCAILREPASRVRSLFSYYTRPEEANSEEGKALREQQLEAWLKSGIRPNSLVDSLKYCKPFRDQVRNHQCAYLSRGKRTFEDARAALETENILLGTSEGFGALLEYLANTFNWPEFHNIRGNVSRMGHEDCLAEPGALDLVNELCKEDRKLYDFVQQQASGFYHSRDWADIPGQGPLHYPLQAPREISRLAWRKVQVRLELNGEPLSGNLSRLMKVAVHNQSREPLKQIAGRGIFFAFRVLDSRGNVLKYECPRTKLNVDVPAGQSVYQEISIEIPPTLLAQAHAIRLGLLYQGRYWVDTVDESHAHTILLSSL